MHTCADTHISRYFCWGLESILLLALALAHSGSRISKVIQMSFSPAVFSNSNSKLSNLLNLTLPWRAWKIPRCPNYPHFLLSFQKPSRYLNFVTFNICKKKKKRKSRFIYAACLSVGRKEQCLALGVTNSIQQSSSLSDPVDISAVF